MEILLIIMFAPLAVAAGFGLLRLMCHPAAWLIGMFVLGVLGIAISG
jgi:hypothetical protein